MIEDFFIFSFNVIFKLIFLIVNIFLYPIDVLIASALPSLAQALNAIGEFFGVVTQYLGFALSITGIPAWVFVFASSYYIFKLTAPMQIYVLKLALQWYEKLKFK